MLNRSFDIEEHAAISSILEKEISLGWIRGPFDNIPFS